MYSLKVTVVVGTFLCAGLLMAQQAAPNQAPAPSGQAAPAQPEQAQPAPAQPVPAQPMRRPPNADRQAHHLGKVLGLSEEQMAQVRPIFAERIRRMENLRTDPTLTPRQRRMQARRIMRDSNLKIEAVLNDTQRQQYEQMLAQRHAHRGPAQSAPPQG